MGTPLQVELPSLSPYSLNDTTTQQSPTPTFHYDSINDQRLYASEHIPPHMAFSPYVNTPRVRASADTSTSKQSGGMGMMNTGLSADDNMPGSSGTMKRTNKTHVPSACVNCKRAHLACDVSRPCKRCVALGKVDTCIDIKHKKRGRPKLKDKKPHPYDTHATADAKTWAQDARFLPPTTTNPNPPNLHQQNDQCLQPSNSFIHTSHQSSSRHHLNHHLHNRVIKPPKFVIPQSTRQTHLQQENTPIITIFLTINSIACARVSDECLGIMGYYPSELVHKSLYDYVHAQDIGKLQKLIKSLLDSASRFYQSQTAHQYQFSPPLSDPVTTEDPGFSQISPEILQFPALGGPIIEVLDMIHLKQRNEQYDLYDVKMYLGGGLCADLTRKETWNKMYIVALFKRIKSGTWFSNDFVQPRMNGSSIVGGFSTQLTSPPTTTIDPALLTMHNTSISNNDIGPSNSNLCIGRSGLLSPVLSPRQIPEIGPTTLYNEVNFNHRKPLHPYNSHDNFSQDRNISEAFVSRSNPVSRPEPFSPIPACSSSFGRRASAFNSVIPFYNEIESKSFDSSSYSNRFHNEDDNVTFNHSRHDDHDEISSSNSFPTFQNNERIVEDMISTIPRKSSSHMGTVEDDSASATRMSVNSLLCN